MQKVRQACTKIKTRIDLPTTLRKSVVSPQKICQGKNALKHNPQTPRTEATKVKLLLRSKSPNLEVSSNKNPDSSPSSPKCMDNKSRKQNASPKKQFKSSDLSNMVLRPPSPPEFSPFVSSRDNNDTNIINDNCAITDNTMKEIKVPALSLPPKKIFPKKAKIQGPLPSEHQRSASGVPPQVHKNFAEPHKTPYKGKIMSPGEKFGGSQAKIYSPKNSEGKPLVSRTKCKLCAIY